MTNSTTSDIDRTTVFGIIVVGVAVAGFSASSLFITAREAGVPALLAWVLPVATDMSALVCTRVWLSPRYPQGIRRYAAAIVLADMVLSFAGASLHLVVQDAPAWMRMAVGGLPSLSLAAIVHLGALIAAEHTRRHITPPARRTPATPEATQRRRPRAEQAPTATASPVDTPEGRPAPHPEAVTPPSGVSTPAKTVAATDNVRPITAGASRRAQMLAYLDENPHATGADLDKEFGTRNYGRGVRRAWETQRQEASGQ